jgi:cysteinyl-tRNA synthetase
MDLRLYDTLTKEKRPFTPLDPSNVRMYVCGPTVYDFAHIGNARPVIVFDVLFRLLRHLAKEGVWDGGKGETKVTYVRNITDVDDKINDRAARDFPGLPLNEAIRKVTELTEKQFHDDVDALGCLRPTVEPRATEHIAEMRTLIERLVQGGFAYVAEDHVLFSPQAMNAANSILPRYGALANRSLDEMIAGARVDVAPYKRDVTDFVLWKPAKPGEPSWPSPAGIAVEGRPGWHIECSAMAWKHLGEQFDIHGGGIDLVFPHHENELAQTCCVFHEARMANVWMHNGFLQVEGDKMSKSTGNFVTIRELLEARVPELIYRFVPETDIQLVDRQRRQLVGMGIRLNMLSTHYRQPIDWTQERLVESIRTLSKWYDLMTGLSMQLGEHGATYYRQFEHAKPDEEFVAALCDDLNAHAAIARLHSLTDNPWRLFGSLDLLGLIDDDVIASRRSIVKRRLEPEQKAKVDNLVEARAAARARKDFKESDRIRDELAAMGVVIKDSKEGTTWEIAR